MRKSIASTLKLKDKAALLFAEGIVDTIYEPLIVLDSDLRVIFANNSFYKYFDVKPSETENKLIYDLGNRQWDVPELKELLEDILPESSILRDFEMTHNFEDIGEKTLLLNARRMDIEKRKPMILISINDITGRKENELILKNRLEEQIDELKGLEKKLTETRRRMDI